MYLEFKSMEALCVLEATPSTATTAAATATAAEPSSLAPPPSLLLRQETSGAKDDPPAPPPTKLWRVPCGKKDIFQSTALSAGEKRQLMKVRRAPGHPRPTNTTQHYADHHYCCQRHPTAPNGTTQPSPPARHAAATFLRRLGQLHVAGCGPRGAQRQRGQARAGTRA
mmetsp:Transcript_61168/g.167674  ORF Transcript_61168/g.167674 Transcript_61168/m.167674 type:complete len:168 (+) Transcript_61168:674-1177(+)